MKKTTQIVLLLGVFLTACAPATPQEVIVPVESPVVVNTAIVEPGIPPVVVAPSLTPVPTNPAPTATSGPLSQTDLKYAVLVQYSDFFFCDPDIYPIARNELQRAQQLFPQLQANQEEFRSILRYNNLSDVTYFNDNQKLLIYREQKKLSAVSLEPSGDLYQFQIQTGSKGQQGSLITGTIDQNGLIEEQQQEDRMLTCPICLAAGTLIDTPRGAVHVEDLQVGDLVWTMNAAGERVRGDVVQLGSVQAPAHHEVVHILLSDGRELWASPGHPTADGRRLDDVSVNDSLDGARVILVERLPYDGAMTYDILPSGETGFYWANGLLLGSTLVEHP